jgi:hypothetical protein
VAVVQAMLLRTKIAATLMCWCGIIHLSSQAANFNSVLVMTTACMAWVYAASAWSWVSRCLAQYDEMAWCTQVQAHDRQWWCNFDHYTPQL